MYDNFIMRAKRTVYKWWCLVYKPVYVLIYHNWPEEKDPYVRYPESKPDKPDADTAVTVDTQPVSATLDPDAQHTPTDSLASQTAPVFPAADTSAHAEDEIPAGVDDDVLARANEIMARLNREAAEDEETVALKWANADWSKAAKVKVFFLDADRKPVAEAVTALIKGKSQKN